MSDSINEKPKIQYATLEEWLKECGDCSALIVRVVEGIVVLHNPKTNEFYLVSEDIQEPHKEEEK